MGISDSSGGAYPAEEEDPLLRRGSIVLVVVVAVVGLDGAVAVSFAREVMLRWLRLLVETLSETETGRLDPELISIQVGLIVAFVV